MKTAFRLLLLSIFFVSCGEADTAVYNGESSNQTLLSFSDAFYTLPIEVDAEGSVDIILNSSTKSDSDRTFPVTIIAEESNADPRTYNLPSSITIPAGEFQGVLTITGQDVDLVQGESKDLVIKVDAPADAIFKKNTATIRVTQVCPVSNDKFVGRYLIQETTPFVDGPTLNHNKIVTLERDGNTMGARRFRTATYINYCPTAEIWFKFSLVCNQVIVPASQNSPCSCAGGLTFGPAVTPATYDADDDSVFYVTFTNDEAMDCGTTAQTTYKFTKQ
jgi:hypothetical protein